MKRSCIPGLLFMGLAVSTGRSAIAQSITGLGVPSGGTWSSAGGISGDGSVVVGWSGVGAFRWTSATGIQVLPPTPGYSGGAALAMSEDGLTTVGQVDGAHPIRAARWDGTGSASLLDVLPNLTQTRAVAASHNANRIVGWGLAGGSALALSWNSTGSVGVLTGLPGSSGASEAHGISADGNTVVGRSGPTWIAVRWDANNEIHAIPQLSSHTVNGYALSASADGSVIVGYMGDGGHSSRAFRWTQAGGTQDLGVLPGDPHSGSHIAATAISSDGSTIIGNRMVIPSTYSIIVWREDIGLVSLDDLLTDLGVDVSAWSEFQIATAVSSTGRYVVGRGIRDGVMQAFLADLGPRGGSTCPADLLADGEVDGKDLAVLLSAWGLINTPANIDRSSSSPTVDGQDLAVLLAGWGACQ